MADKQVVTTGKARAIEAGGASERTIVKSFPVSTADGDGSVYRIIPNLAGDVVIKDLTIHTTALGTGAAVDLGIYKSGVGSEAIDDDKLMAAESFVAAANNKDGLKNLSVAERAKPLYELAGHTIKTRRESYDLALTFDTIGDADGVITVVATLVQY